MAEELNNMEGMEPVEDNTKVLIAIHKKSDGTKLAVTEEQYSGYDKRSWAADGVIIRNADEFVQILISLNDASKPFGQGPEDIPASDKRRRNYVSPTMTELDGRERTDYLLSEHAGEYGDGCALCYCNDLGMFMPAGGEMQKAKDYLDKVNNLIVIAGGSEIAGLYWTSTLYSWDYPWFMDVEDNSFGFWKSKINSLNVRPMGDASDYQEVE